MRVAVIGRTRMLLESARVVAEAGHTIPLVVTSPAAPHYGVGADAFEKFAAEVDATYRDGWELDTPGMVDRIAAYECDVAISINWKTRICASVLEAFPHGIINCHAGDLPRYRGNAAVNWALIAGEDTIVFTLHEMVEALDAGPIVLQREMTVGPRTRLADVYAFGVRHVPGMFREVLAEMADGTLTPRPQESDPRRPLRCYPRRPADSALDWTAPASRLDRLIRASSEPLFGAYTWYAGNKLTIWRAHPEQPEVDVLGTPGQVAEVRSGRGEVAVLTGDGVLVLEEVETEADGRTTAAAVIESNRDRLRLTSA